MISLMTLLFLAACAVIGMVIVRRRHRRRARPLSPVRVRLHRL
jgi:hypothetical protein